MTKNYKAIIEKLKNERYPDAKTIFWAGSIAKNQASKNSDLDLIIVFEELDHAYREAYIYEDVPIDAFVHDEATIKYFFNEVDKTTFILGLPTMIAEGIELPKETEFGNSLRARALNLVKASPTISVEALKSRRFKISDLLDDLQNPKNNHEQISIIFDLYSQLAEFYLLANRQWIGSGKQLARKLECYNPKVAEEFRIAFSDLNNIPAITEFTKTILAPFGGLLWNGFRFDSPK